ncbi:replication factor C subunit [Aureococcus anophagefferens]|uniref:Replication factor C subunit n=1 Tax=Aureococcus anophagefferens TaxID=44056 RepID=A0ABR1FM37_AURAN
MADWEVDDDDVEGLEEFDDLYKEDDAEEAVEVAEEAADAGPRVDISKITSSAERNILSKRNRIWSVHAVLRPRRALPHDATDDWVERYFPEHLADFANPKLNREALGALQSCAQKKELQNFVVHGPRGAGKTAACLAFLRGFAADDGSAKSKRSRGKKAKQQRASGGAYPTLRLSSADAKTAGDLEKKLKAFVREAERVNGEGSTKFVVLDGIDSLTPHAQQGVYHNMISYDKTVGFLFTALNKDRIIDKFAKRCAILPMRRLDKGDALGVFLNVAARERVGYEHRGAVMLFEHAKAGRGELGRAVRSLQRVFAKWEYASYVCKEFAPDAFNAKRKIAAKAALGDPIDRCAVCTLRPPCQHVSEQELATRGLARRAELPERDDSIDCTNFVKCGSCRVFNEFGHCSLDHPSTLHCVVLPPHRCPQCTLVWPCQHCSFSGSRNRLIESCTLVAQWVPHYRDDRPTLDVAAKKHESVADVVVDLDALDGAVDDLVARVAAAEAFIAGTMCIDEAVYRKRRKEVHDDHDAITSKIGKFLPEQPPLNDDGKFAFPPDPLRLALEYLLKLGESPPAKDDGPKKKAGIPKQRRR